MKEKKKRNRSEMDDRKTNIKKSQKECVWIKATKGVQYLTGLEKKKQTICTPWTS